MSASPPDVPFGNNIRLAYTFQALVNASLWMPIWVVFLNTDRHLTLGRVYLIAGAEWVIQAVAEVPTGALADTYGRKVTLVAGSLTLALGLLLLATLNGFSGLLIAYLFWAAGNALISGSDTALLYDSAVALGREEEFSHMASISFQILLAAQAIGSIAGGILGAIDLRIPILVTAALTVCAVTVVLRMGEPPRHEHQTTSWARTMRTATGYVLQRPRVLSLLTYAALLSGTAFFVPFVLFQPAMQSQGVAVGWLGVLFTGLRLAALAGSRYGPRMISTSGLTVWLWLTPALMAAGFVAVAASHLWWLTFLAMLYLAATNAAIRPAVTTLLNRQVTGAVRATVISLQSLTMTLFIAVLHPAVGAVADATSTAGAFLFLAAVCALPCALTVPLRPIAVTDPTTRPTQPTTGTPRPHRH
jgi:MFS family permease